MAFSVNTPVGDGVTKQFAVNFTNGIFSRDSVHVFVEGEVDGLGDPIERTFTWINDGLIELDGDAPASGLVIEIRRIMDKDEPAVDFEDGEILTEETMDRSVDHLLNSIHELLDGYGFSSIQTDINMNGNRVTGLGAPQNPDDAARVSDVAESASAAVLRQEIASGIRRAATLSTLESTNGRFDGDAARLVSGTGRDGDFRWDSSDLSSTLVLASATSDSVDDTTDTINDADHPFSDGDGVITQTTVNGLTAHTVYWVVNSTSGTYQLSATFGGGAIDLTGTTNFTVDHLFDPRQAIWVTPSSDRTGASGSWVRQYGQAVMLYQSVNAAWWGLTADWNGSTGTDNVQYLQPMIDMGFKENRVPGGEFMVSSTLFLGQAQSLIGLRSTNYNIGDEQSTTLIFRPGVADTCIQNKAGTVGHVIQDMDFDCDRNDCFGLAFTSTYSNSLLRVGFTGTWDVTVFADDTYVCDFDTIRMNGASVRRYCVYFGDTNSSVVRRLHTSGLPNDAAVPLVGVGILSGKSNKVVDCLFQGLTIGVSLRSPKGTTIENAYGENTLCLLRSGDPTASNNSAKTTVIGGFQGSAEASHPQYANRGPLLYCPRTDRLSLLGLSFEASSVSHTQTFPVVTASTTNIMSLNDVRFFQSNARAEVFRETSSASPRISIFNEEYGSNGAQEIILKADGAFGGASQGIRVDTGGVISAVGWSPTVMAAAVDPLLTAAFDIPTVP